MMRTLRLLVVLSTIGMALPSASPAANLDDGEALAREQCGTCHVGPGETVGLAQARPLPEVIHIVDWKHLRLREWFATAHPTRLSFQVTDRDLHELRLYLMDLDSQSMLGDLGGD